MNAKSYLDIPIWKKIPEYIPESNRLDESINLQEWFWEWVGKPL